MDSTENSTATFRWRNPTGLWLIIFYEKTRVGFESHSVHQLLDWLCVDLSVLHKLVRRIPSIKTWLKTNVPRLCFRDISVMRRLWIVNVLCVERKCHIAPHDVEKYLCSIRLVVRTPPSQGENTGSTPVWSAKFAVVAQKQSPQLYEEVGGPNPSDGTKFDNRIATDGYPVKISPSIALVARPFVVNISLRSSVVERLADYRDVVGSIPTVGTNFASLVQW